MEQFDDFPEEYSPQSSTPTDEYQDQLADLTDIKIQSVMTDMTEMTPLPDDIVNPSEYFEKMKASQNDNILSNAPPPVHHFVGEQHDSIYESLFDDLTYDNMNPFIVLLGSEGIGKTSIITSICSELLHENNPLFKDGILYIDLMYWHNAYKHNTFEECLIASVKQCGLDSHWIAKHDDFLELLPSNIFRKIDEYLSNSLIILEDFDRFMEANHMTLEECNRFLFCLFENISLQTKIVLTSRKKLPIYYNFNAFRTKFYEIASFSATDAINYVLRYCPTFREEDIVPYLDDIRDLTSFKPLYMHSLYKLWENVRLFESTFDSIITLYQQIDHPQLLLEHNPYNNQDNNSETVSNINPVNIEKSTTKASKNANPKRLRLSVSNSPVSSPKHNGANGANDIQIKEEEELEELPGLQPLFAYTNLYCAPNSPAIAEFHSPLSTMNGPTLGLDHNFSANSNPVKGSKKKKSISKQTRQRSSTSDGRKRSGSIGLQLLDPKRRRSEQVQQFYKHTQRYSFDAQAQANNQYEELILPKDSDDAKDEHYRFAPLSPLSPLQLRRKMNMNIAPLKAHHSDGVLTENKSANTDNTVFNFAPKEQEREKKRRIKGDKTSTNTRKDTPRQNVSHAHVNSYVSALSANNLRTHLNMILLGDLNISESGTNDDTINIEEIMAFEPEDSARKTEENGNDENEDGNRRQNEDDNFRRNDEDKETYDGFLSALGAEIQRQQKQETHKDEESQSMQNYNIQINDVDISTNNHNTMIKTRSRTQSGIRYGFLDLPATPPLSSCGGYIDSEGFGDNVHDMDNMSVNSDIKYQNKLISIKLINNKTTLTNNDNHMKYVQHLNKKDDDNSNSNNNHDQDSRLTVGDVHFNKFLRMTLLLNIAIDSWSRKWLINGVARSLRTADVRFGIHKAQDIATQYSYVSLLCRCDEYDIKQLKQIFEFSFISSELEKCVAQSLGQPQLKIICASCVSYRHFKYLYSKQFLNWMKHSLPNANIVHDYCEDHENVEKSKASQIKNNKDNMIYHHLNDKIVQRKQYSIPGMHKMSIMNAQHIQLPYAQKDIASQDPMNASQTHRFNQAFGIKAGDDNSSNNNNHINESLLLTPPNMTVYHFMSVIS